MLWRGVAMWMTRGGARPAWGPALDISLYEPVVSVAFSLLTIVCMLRLGEHYHHPTLPRSQLDAAVRPTHSELMRHVGLWWWWGIQAAGEPVLLCAVQAHLRRLPHP